MIRPVLPPDEGERIKSLHSLDLLDTKPEERFDRLTRLAKKLFDVPVALVSLVDTDRQWFKSRPDFPVSETPREISFCGHTILDDEIFIVEDSHRDKRFFDNPLVTDFPEVRFYAGYPLLSTDRRNIGTLCIIDHRPRKLSPDDISSLRDLAILVEREINTVHLATYDELTRIPNRRGFGILSQSGLNMCSRLKIPAALALFDLDKFKDINDSYGHAEGDNALSLFAGEMKKIFRNSDVLGRIGGDEFAVFMVNSDAATTVRAIERLRSGLEKHKERMEYGISFSEGVVSLVPGEDTMLKDMLCSADSIMYRKKKERGAR